MQDEKYICFKRDEWDMMYGKISPHGLQPVTDAVVIRRQDLFAGPALHSYAASIAIVAKMTPDDYGKRLQEIADYFSEQAVLADAEGYKLPD